MDEKVSAVLDAYHEMMRHETREPVPGGRDGGQDRRMRAVGPQTGQLINILARSLDGPTILEIGTSFGYSGIWLAEAARVAGGRLVTMELHGYKSDFAREMAEKAGLAEHVEFQVGDAVQLIADLPSGIDFVLVDLWKDLYVQCLNAVLPKLNPGAILVADNVRPGKEDTRAYVLAVRDTPKMVSLHLPVGQGLEISRYDSEAA